jgi:hypothetical protein
MGGEMEGEGTPRKPASGGIPEPREGAARPRRRARRLGTVLTFLGGGGLPLALGVVGGFYLADQGAPWFPDTLELLLGVCLLSIAALVGGFVVQGKAVSSGNPRQPLRKRLLAALAAGSVVLMLLLVLDWARDPSPLTEISSRDFNVSFEENVRRYHEYDAGLERMVSALESDTETYMSRSGVVGADQEQMLLDVWEATYNYAYALDQIREFYEDWYRFDPSRSQRSYFLRSYLLSYAAELSLYQHATRVIRVIEENKNVAKFLDSPHPSRDLPANSFSHFRNQIQGARDQARVVAGKRYLEVLDDTLQARNEATALGAEDLWNDVAHHLAVLDEIGGVEQTALTIESGSEVFKRRVKRNWYPAQTKVAEWMGDTRVRRAGRYLITHEQQEQMDAELLPGDIMLSRKNWYVSNVGLPGFWPHAILYVGDPGKFDAYFNDPEVLAWVEAESGEASSLLEYIQREMPSEALAYRVGRAGHPHRVIEAISEGVVLNGLDHVCGDYTAVLRPRLSKVEKARAIVFAFRQLSKPYDFEFDFATDHALVCTELVWRAYRPRQDMKGLDLPLVKLAGRRTLPANEIAKIYASERGAPDAQLEFVYFIDTLEREQQAVVSDEDGFLKTPSRNKWDVVSH